MSRLQWRGDTVKTLLNSSILDDAGVPEPYKESTTGANLTPVAVGRRNNGAAIGAVAYAKFLNYPGTQNAFPPASKTIDNAVDEDATLPIVKSPGGASDTGNLLKDWQNGTGGDPWRYIRIDGYAPTLENVAAGVYPHWAEGSVIYRTKKASDGQWAVKTKLLKAFADDLGSPTVANAVNTTQAWGKTGIFATTADPRGFTASVPFNTSNPVVPLTHKNGGSTHADIVPVVNNAVSDLAIQLK